MSATATGGSVIGALFLLPLLAGFVATLLAGAVAVGAVYLAGRAIVAGVRAYADSERRARENARRELERLDSQAASQALAQQQKFSREFDKSIDEITGSITASHARMKALADGIAAQQREGTEAFNSIKVNMARMREERLEEARLATARLSDAVKSLVREQEAEISGNIKAQSEDFQRRIQQLADRREAKNALALEQARRTLKEAEELRGAIENGYDYKEYAPREREALLDLEKAAAEQIAGGFGEAAYASAVSVAGGVQRWLLKIEERQLAYSLRRAFLERQAQELAVLARQAGQVLDAENPEHKKQMEAFGIEETSLDYWSEGRWEEIRGKIAALRERVDRLRPSAAEADLAGLEREIRDAREAAYACNARGGAAVAAYMARVEAMKRLHENMFKDWKVIQVATDNPFAFSILYYREVTRTWALVGIKSEYSEEDGMYRERVTVKREDQDGTVNERTRDEFLREVNRQLGVPGMELVCDEATRGMNENLKPGGKEGGHVGI